LCHVAPQTNSRAVECPERLALRAGLRALLALLLLFCIRSGATAADLRFLVPHTASGVMIDGTLSKDEWQDAKRIEVPGVATLYFEQSAESVYIAVEYSTSPSGIVDLYLSPAEGKIYDLHTSAKLGERQRHASAYSDWTWWNNRDWTANVSRVKSFEKRTFLPTPVREYQIRRARFPSVTWRLRFELTAMTTNNETRAITIFPPATTDGSTAGWLVLDLA
jgi:hypothetical protein